MLTFTHDHAPGYHFHNIFIQEKYISVSISNYLSKIN